MESGGGGGGRKGVEKGGSLDSKLRESLTLFRLTTDAVVKVEFSIYYLHCELLL